MKETDLGLIVTQIFNVTEFINKKGISIDNLDLSNVFIRGNMIKLSYFGVSLIPFRD